MYALNPAMEFHVLQVGEENTPVILIDDFLADINYLRGQLPGRQEFDNAQSFYPGIRALIPNEFVQFVINQMEPQVRRVYALPEELALGVHYGVFSIVTRKSNELIIPQRIPHYDTCRPFYFAMLLYLSEGDFGGTAFYRHSVTGYERISELRKMSFFSSVKSYIETHGEPALDYCRDENQQFEKLLEISYRANRIIVYPGNLLHSGVIQESRDIYADPLLGRVTANIFADYTVSTQDA